MATAYLPTYNVSLLMLRGWSYPQSQQPGDPYRYRQSEPAVLHGNSHWIYWKVIMIWLSATSCEDFPKPGSPLVLISSPAGVHHGFLVAGVLPGVDKPIGRWSTDSFHRYWRSLDDKATRSDLGVRLWCPNCPLSWSSWGYSCTDKTLHFRSYYMYYQRIYLYPTFFYFIYSFHLWIHLFWRSQSRPSWCADNKLSVLSSSHQSDFPQLLLS